MWRVSTDTGGTFTDLVAISDSGEIRVTKTPSTPPDFENGVLAALRDIGLAPEETGALYHGTTVTTNALLTRTGAKTGLISTRGFRDVIEIRRGNREDVFDVMWDQPEPLVPRYNRLEVTERLNYRGEVLQALVEDDVRAIARALNKRDIEAVAVCLIHSYVNPTHERRIREILAEECPQIYVCLSSDVLPEPPEFERTSTATANAFVAPVLRKYVERLQSALAGEGREREVVIMHSGGGLMSTESALTVPIRTATSGPAAGVVAAAAIGAAIGRRNLVSLDMGGTSTDIATIQDGRPRLTVHHTLEWGMPIGFPSIDLVAIGTGGGSIGWIDEGGAPRSGPESAGSLPGPACYGLGGENPTNTDANVVLGRLTASAFLGGRMKIHESLAHAAIETKLAGPLGLDVHRAALGLLTISNENMTNALRRVTIERGLDPRDFSLVAFGGAGPMHAVELALALEIPEVIVPPAPGATSAMGLLFVDHVHDLSRSYIKPTGDIDIAEAEALYRDMEADVAGILEGEGFTAESSRSTRLIDLRYMGQVRALTIELPAMALTRESLDRAVARFREEYEREFKYSLPHATIEAKTLRVSGVGMTGKPAFHPSPNGTHQAAVPASRRDVYFAEAGGFVETAVFERTSLRTGDTLTGPALVEQFDGTTVLPPGTQAHVDQFGNLIVTTASA